MEKYLDSTFTPQERAEDLVSRMTLEEKIGQLRYDAPAIDRLGIPAYNWWSEGLHGVARAGTATMFPQAIAMAAMFDCDELNKVADIIATEGRAKYNSFSSHGDRDVNKGLTFWSPNVNIFRDPRWGRGHETYGECPYLTSKLGVAYVKGLQGDGEFMKAAACAKHFAVHSGPEAVRHHFDAVANDKDITETYLPAFEALVEAGVEGVMGAYNRLNGVPTCAHPFLMGKLKEWKFDGYFVSDCWALQDFHTGHMVTATVEESAAMAIKAGCDCNCGNTYIHMMNAYDEGLIDEADITRAAVHLMRTRIRLGLFEQHTEFDDIGLDKVACREHRDEALTCAQRSMVLLKNDGMLPLDKSKLKSIAVIGPNANSLDALRGNYYGTAAGYTTFLDGIYDAVGDDVRVYYAEGCDLIKPHICHLSQDDDGIAEAVDCAEHSDAVVLCVGLDATLEGEEGDVGNEFDSGDKRDLFLTQPQKNLIAAVLKVGKPTVIVLSCGSSINPLGNDANAIIQAWYPGEGGGKALADILFGKVSPSGKLPVTFYESADKLPDFQDYSMAERTYRNLTGNVLYPFGFGLTYGKVSVDSAKLDGDTVTVTLSNSGKTDVDEVVQLYIRSEDDANEVRNHRLCGFKRVTVKAGGSVECKLTLEPSAFDVVDDKGVKYAAKGSFTLWAGVSQPDELSGKLGAPACIKLSLTK